LLCILSSDVLGFQTGFFSMSATTPEYTVRTRDFSGDECPRPELLDGKGLMISRACRLIITTTAATTAATTHSHHHPQPQHMLRVVRN
jgi:hypothetical protein